MDRKIGDMNNHGHVWNGFEYVRLKIAYEDNLLKTGDEMKISILENNFKSILNTIEENPERTGIQETPLRVAKAWKEWTSGYYVDIPKLFKVNYRKNQIR